MTVRRTSTLVNIVAMLVYTVVRRFLGLIGMASLARMLSPGDLGAYAFTQTTGQTFVGLFRFGALQGLHVSLGRRMADDDADDAGALIGGGIMIVSTIAILGSAAMVLLADPIARDLFGAPDLAPYVTASAACFTGQFLSRAAYVGFAGLGRFVDYTYWSTAIGIATVAATILGAVLYGVQGAVWGFAGTTLAGVPIFVLGLLRALKRVELRIRWQLSLGHLKEIFSIGLPFYGAGVFMILAGFVAQGAVSRFGSVQELADLRIVLTLMAVVQMIPQSISGPIISLFAEREGRETGSGSVSAFEHMRWLWIFALITSTVLAAIWPLTVLVVFGTGYPQAAQIGQLAIAAFIPTIVGTALSAGILVGGRTLPLLVVGALQGAAMSGVALTLVPAIGLTGFFAAQAAASTTAAVLWLLALGWLTRNAPLRPWMGPLLAATLVLCAGLILDARIDETPLQRILVAAGVVPAMILWVAFTALSGADRRMLRGRARHEAGKLQSWLRMRKGAERT
ncbi:oligosaccharide flippase family protein [Histidinibacterium lentulum]|uniref:Lipopolysaccharide biosynthesis protein n=1 Tax=Histidinibacterium lentulum TaxID=2480588 RepID=A0A3N2QV33_9RHOB|nr:oligosaccharide flippase family protein [Histidinibacterium lentulum]ROT99098.1 hypothetical protein EAT49_15910 [Histidinibacterium lentulum]